MLMKNGEHKTDIELHACTELVHVIDTQIDYPSKSKCRDAWEPVGQYNQTSRRAALFVLHGAAK